LTSVKHFNAVDPKVGGVMIGGRVDVVKGVDRLELAAVQRYSVFKVLFYPWHMHLCVSSCFKFEAYQNEKVCIRM